MSHHHSHHNHTHDHSDHHHSHIDHIGKDRRSLLIAMITTASIMVVQLIGSYIANSIALRADAGHMLTDVGALLVAYLALRLYEASKNDKKKLQRFTFGFKRVEIIAALVNGVVLLSVCVLVIKEAVERLLGHSEHVHGDTMLAVAGFGFIANGISAIVLYKSHHLSTRSAYLHVMSDLLSSLAVIIGGIIMHFTHIEWIDPVLSLLIIVFIVRNGYKLVRSAARILMDVAPKGADRTVIENAILSVEGVKSVHDIHVWQIDTDNNAVSAHIVSDGQRSHEEILGDVRFKIENDYSLSHSTFQIESDSFAQSHQCNGCESTKK
jgi:cobalt-zinc-cadmium efflux system protein